MDQVFDIAIIGGGINGCGIARDAAGRGYSVFLCEMNDLASGTSSASTKLIHGGLRYLEFYDFRLVREALIEREVLWGIAPHIIQPLRFVLPYRQGLRPAWLIRLGLFLYDHLGARRRLPPTRVLDLGVDPAGRPLRPHSFAKAFEYSDCRVDDSRLVVLNAVDAAKRGAVIKTRTRAVSALREDDAWSLSLLDRNTKEAQSVRAKALVNAAGPWVERTLTSEIGVKPKAHVRLVQGSHIVVPKLFDHDRAYILQNTDGRIVFAIPYQQQFTLVGTTDRDFTGEPAQARPSEDEIDYLCAAVSRDFAHSIRPPDVVWAFTGVRPLYDDGVSEARAATRDYVFEIDDDKGRLPVLSIFGGKITTYRRLAEEALARLRSYLPEARGAERGWTARSPLPGGDFADYDGETLVADIRAAYAFLTEAHARRLVYAYGTRAREILGSAHSADDLGREFGATLTEAEVRFLVAHEWARSAEDIVWRRSKLALRLTPHEIAELDRWMDSQGKPAQ